MSRQSQPMWQSAIVLVLMLLLSALVACGGDTEPAASVVASPTAEDAPAGVLKARESVLDFLRQGANECVPPVQAGWTPDEVINPPDGYDVYRFLSGECAITITVAGDPGDDPVYHVALGDGATGFCWQSVVDAHGQILLTGNAAQTDETLGNPAKAYCEQQGYTFEIVTLESGQLCGKCVFESGLSCNAWAFFHGVCTPENVPSAVP